ncbi:RWD domain-containing protein 3-like [Babylonia areolata]|uniref:RWD domain-containing protein 3-like n=1 Tax=Babylonia areolata TaxID=304850 RepID=UPI003FCFAA3B
MADDEELEVIQAIFCQPGEICVTDYGGEGGKEVKVRLEPDLARDEPPHGVTAQLCLSLPSSYPSTQPDISVRSDSLSREEITHLRKNLCAYATENLGNPILLDLINLAGDYVHKLVEHRQEAAVRESKTCPKSQEAEGVQSQGTDCRLVLLHLDHMRAKTQYVKLIKKWVGELSLNGCLMFCQRLILIVLQGSSSAVKEYIVRQRTSNVDVDARGHACKERMLSVLCDIPLEGHHHRFDSFGVVEKNTAGDLEEIFSKWCLRDIFSEHVERLKHFPGR